MVVPAAAAVPVVLTKLRRELSFGEWVLVSFMVKKEEGSNVGGILKPDSGHQSSQNGG